MLKKLFIAFMAICMSVFSFTSCGDEEETKKNSATFTWEAVIEMEDWVAEFPKPADEFKDYASTSSSYEGDTEVIFTNVTLGICDAPETLIEDYLEKLKEAGFVDDSKKKDGYMYFFRYTLPEEGDNMTYLSFRKRKLEIGE